MLDIKLIRENPEIVRRNLAKRGDPDNLRFLDELILLDKEWRQLLTKVNELRHKRRIITEEIAKLKKAGKDTTQKVKDAQSIPEKIEKLEAQVEERKEKAHHILLRLPNLLHESVPFGKDEKANEIIRVAGSAPRFEFKPKFCAISK